MQIAGRWLRLALPAYLLILFTATIFPFFAMGPSFLYLYDTTMLNGIHKYWWTWLLFIQNWVPWSDCEGIYWIYYLANDLQFYAFILCPSLYFYMKRNSRLSIVIFLNLLIFESMVYMFTVTLMKDYSSMLNFDLNDMYNDFYKRPFGPVGYYAMGILLSIYYFEYS